MADTVRWGVAGSGGIARRRTIPEGIMAAANASLAAVYDVDSQANQEVAEEFGAEAVSDPGDLLTADVDAVYIATPAVYHLEQALAAAQAGKHVLCEKPLGMTVAESERMIEVSEEAGVVLGTAFMNRFNSQHRAALQMIEEGKLGALVYGRAQLSCWYPPIEGAWRQDPATGGGGSLIDMGGHCIDLLEMFFGELEAVSCFINNTVHDYESEDAATAMLRFASGALATVDTFCCIPDNSSKNMLEIYGSKGSIIGVGTIGQGPAGEMTAYLQESEEEYETTQAREAVGGEVIAPEPANTYMGEVAELSAAVLEGRQPMNNAQLGLQSQKVLAACYESARTGQVVRLLD